MAEVLNVEVRELLGKRNNRRLRAAGSVPAVLYGHGEKVVNLTVSGTELDLLTRRGQRVVTLAGAVDEQAFIRECQWNVWGTEVIHVDFTRVSEHERVQVVVAIELRGEALGVKQGGVVDHVRHELQIECEIGQIPEKISLNINTLDLDESITVGALELPEGVTALDDASATVVQCAMPLEERDEEDDGLSAEPEVIGRKAEDEDESK